MSAPRQNKVARMGVHAEDGELLIKISFMPYGTICLSSDDFRDMIEDAMPIIELIERSSDD